MLPGKLLSEQMLLKDFMAGLTDFLAGDLRLMKKVLIEGKDTALKRITGALAQMGANAVIGIDLDY